MKKKLYVYCFASEKRIVSFDWKPQKIKKVKCIPLIIDIADIIKWKDYKILSLLGVRALSALINASYGKEIIKVPKMSSEIKENL